MAVLRRRKIGRKYYYYLEHSYKSGKKVKVVSKYFGSKKPENIDELKKELEFRIMRENWKKDLLFIKKKHSKEKKHLPKIEQLKKLDTFAIEFIYNSNKIEGSKLSFKETANLFIHGTTPKDKPLKDVKEAEGYKKAFYDMLAYKKNLNMRKVCEWHKMIFKESDPDIAGKIRLHKIIVTGSRVSFPHPEIIQDLLFNFFKWYKNNKHRFNTVEFSALVHLRFVTIHPFTDGNGRISRLIANHVLNTNNYPMFTIKFGDRKAYYSNLETSQLWIDEKHFIRFYIKRYISENKK